MFIMYVVSAAHVTKPADTNPLAITLSLVSVVVAILALGFTLLWRPRPFITIERSEITNNVENKQPQLKLSIANRGNANAYDVRAHVKPVNDSHQIEYVGTLGPDEARTLTLMVTPLVEEKDGFSTWLDGPVDEKTIRAVVRWREPPILKWYRRKVVRPGKHGEDLVWSDRNPYGDSD